MNIFVLDKDPSFAALYHCDKHVPKMVVELFQQLGSALIRNGAQESDMPLTSKGTPLKGGYHNHPCTRWCGDSRSNFIWASTHALYLCGEYSKRFGKIHSCEKGIVHLSSMEHFIPEKGLTPHAQAMPPEYKCIDPVRAYRNYYKGAKKDFAKWEKINNIPYWWDV